MGKGSVNAEFTIRITLQTLGGMGKVTADVKATEGRNIVLEYEVPMIKNPRNSEFMEPTVVSRYDAEEKYKEVAAYLEGWIRSHAPTD